MMAGSAGGEQRGASQPGTPEHAGTGHSPPPLLNGTISVSVPVGMPLPGTLHCTQLREELPPAQELAHVWLSSGGVSLAVAPTSWTSTLPALAWLQPPLRQALQQTPLCTSAQGVPSPLPALCLPSWPGAMLDGTQHDWQQSRVSRGGSAMGLAPLLSDGAHHRFHLGWWHCTLLPEAPCP